MNNGCVPVFSKVSHMSSTREEWREAVKAAQALPGWGERLRSHMSAEQVELVGHAFARSRCFPPPNQVFRSLEAVGTPDRVRVVILGQDPYHGAGQADGLAFSVQRGTALPPSLRNIFKEIAQSCGGTPPLHGDLSSWASQGVLLLNDVLTVEEGKAHSHRELGWQEVGAGLLSLLDARPVAFLLWGKHAGKRAAELGRLRNDHLILEAPHPSPLSAYRGFLGCGHFRKVNEWLQARNEEPILWWPDGPGEGRGDE